VALYDVRHMPGDDLKSEKGSKRTYTRVYTARSTDPKANPLEILRDTALPQEREADPWDSRCIIVAAQAKRRGKALDLWDISLTSTTEADVDTVDDPLNAPPKWSGRTRSYEVPIIFDIKGQPIQNSAGDLFTDASAKKKITGWQFTANVSVGDVSFDWLDDFTECVNETPLVVRHKRCDRGTLMFIEAVIGEPQRSNGVIHCPSTFTFEYKPDGWKFKPLNKGFRELSTKKVVETITGWPDRSKYQTVTNTYKRLDEILDEKGQPITEPAFLNRDGKRPTVEIIPGNPYSGTRVKVPLELSDIVTLEFDVVPYVDFNVLGIFR
jgi:hypothetical protein